MSKVTITEAQQEELRDCAAIAFCMLEFADARLQRGDSLGTRWGNNNPEAWAFKAVGAKLWDSVNALPEM